MTSESESEEITTVELEESPTGEEVHVTVGKGLPSYRPWDWITGWLLAAAIAGLMFGLAESTYNL